MQLRPYQDKAIAALFEWWNDKYGLWPLIVLPTAAGKTIVFSTIIRMVIEKYPETRIMVLAHTKELVDQAEKKLLSVWPDAPVGVYAASLNRRQIKQITVASRDTIRNVIEDIGKFDLVFIDEAHLIAPSETSGYMKIIAALKAVNPHVNVIGFTATPYRTGTGVIYGNDDKHIFSDIAYEAKIADLMKQGYLCPIVAKPVDQSSVVDTSGIKTTAGDFNRGELQEAATQEPLIRASINEWIHLAANTGRRSSVFFCVSILHAELVSQELLKKGFDCPVVHGATPSQERDQILAEFDEGKLIGVVNVGCLTTGWDAPRLDCVVIMRPTKSLGLFMQMVGRGLRLHESKVNTLLLDFGGCLERFGPIDIAQPTSRKRLDKRTKVCPSCESIIGFFKKKCPHCYHQLQAPAVKICDACGEENAPSAAKCVACDKPFVTHEKRASDKAVLSQDLVPDLKQLSVESVTIAPAKAKSGRDYLRITYVHDIFNRYTMNLMLGYPGYAGEKAAEKWQQIARSGVPVPESPAAAYNWYKHDPNILRAVNQITVNMNSKYQDIVAVDYIEEVATA